MLICTLILIIGIAGIVSGAVLTRYPIMIAGAVLAAAGAVIGVIGIIRKNKAEKENAIRRETYISALSGADSARKAYNNALRKRDEFMNAHKELRLHGNQMQNAEDESEPGYSSGAEIADEIKNNLEQIDHLRQMIGEYEKQTEEKQERISGISEKRAKAAELTALLDEGREKIRRIELARDLMIQAKTI